MLNFFLIFVLFNFGSKKMHQFLSTICLFILLSFSCSNVNLKNNMKDHDKLVIEKISAYFKTCERIDKNNLLLVFRRVDNCRYIVFKATHQEINKMEINFLLPSIKDIKINDDLIDLKFSIKYTKSNLYSQGENINRIISINRTLTDKFSVAGIEDSLKVETFMIKLKKFIESDNIHKLSGLISYPFKANIQGKRKEIRKNTFLKYYKDIFNKRVKDSILNQSTSGLFASSRGLMVGRGEIWLNKIDGKIVITAINNI